jgi:hypothetical protein
MSIVLLNQISAAEKSADDLSEELRDHRTAMLCYEVESLLKLIVIIYAVAGRMMESWQKAAKDHSKEKNAQISNEAFMMYKQIAIVCEKSAQVVRGVEGFGFTVAGKRDFQIVWRKIRGITCFTPDQVEAGLSEIARGEMRPLEDVQNDLWDTPVV